MQIAIEEKIKMLLGREIEVEETTFKGQRGFLPLYFNYTFKNNVSDIFDTNKEECLKKFHTFLENNQGDTNGTDTDSGQGPGKED